MKIVGIFPARYNSSRFQGKLLADICGKPMIQEKEYIFLEVLFLIPKKVWIVYIKNMLEYIDLIKKTLDFYVSTPKGKIETIEDIDLL